VKLATRLRLAPNWRSTVLLLRHMPSWYARGQLYYYLAILSVGYFNSILSVLSPPDEDSRLTEISVLSVWFSPF